MKETTIAFITFFLTIFFVVQIKLIGRIRKQNKIKREIAERGEFHSSFVQFFVGCCCLEDVCSSILCCAHCTACLATDGESHDPITRDTSERKLKRRYKERIEKEEKRKEKYGHTPAYLEREKTSAIKLLGDKEKASTWWISSTAKLTEERVIEIFTDSPGYIIVDDYVYNEKAMIKEDFLAIKERVEGGKICPNCENPVEDGSKYCSNCGTNI